MRVVVVGATGNVGTCLLDLLAGDPRVSEIRGLARRPPARRWPRTTFAPLDLSKDDPGPEIRGADVVVHLAWLLQPTHRPTVTWSANVGGSIRLFEAVVAHNVPVLLYASSVGAYSPAPGQEVNESWPTDGLPTAAYGREKAYVERVLDAVEARRPELRVVRFRPAFIFQRASGSHQRRLFAGPFLPTSLLQPGRAPILPYPAGLHLQALHASDAASAYHLAMTGEARGAFNLASTPVIDGPTLARVMGSRPLPVPRLAVRTVLGGAWRVHLVPAEPALLDLALGLPIMGTQRARTELGWSPRVSAVDALAEALTGMREGAGTDTPPLAPHRRGRRPIPR